MIRFATYIGAPDSPPDNSNRTPLHRGEAWKSSSPWEPVSLDAGFILWKRAVFAARGKSKGAGQAFAWAKSYAPQGRTAEDVCVYVAGLIELVTGQRPDPTETKTTGKQLMGLWNDVGRPDWPSFAKQIGGVARWARESPDPLAARDIRAEGWDDGVNRSRSIATLTVKTKWHERLAAAREWARNGYPAASDAPTGGRRGDLRSESVEDEVEAWRAAQSKEST